VTPDGTSDRQRRARRVLDVELAGLTAVRERIGASFDRALDLLHSCRGKVVVTGVGKSGIVGRKIAATFASTGTPALFLHAGEGSHGDLGVLAGGDVLVALSYSGESPELLCLLPLAQRLAVPLLVLSGTPQSSLARAADVLLDVSVPAEACPLGLAPTASTTAAMAVGDALAVALFEERGFTVDDFALLHPGGALGRRLLRVEDVMRREDALPRVPEGASLKDTIGEISGKRLGMTTVVDAGGDLAGIITDGDLRRGLERADDIRMLVASDLMTRTPKTIERSALAAQAVAVMERYPITSLVVLEDGTRRPVGVIHLHDVLRAGVV
jgi:arabinose-5-phosphate isomerase